MKRLILAAALICAARTASADELYYGFKSYDHAVHYLTTVCAQKDGWFLRTFGSNIEESCEFAKIARTHFYEEKADAEAKAEAAKDEARRAEAWKHPQPGEVSLCPKPRHMTAHDGCQ